MAHQSNRLEGLDLARYIAFVGMVIVNFKIVMEVGEETGLLSAFTTALEGRAAATFVVLAGLGLGLAGWKGFDKTPISTAKRAAFLLVLGLLNMTVFDADIVHYYAFYFLLGVFFLPLRTSALTGIIIALNVAFTIMILALDYDAGWNWDDYTYADFWTVPGFVRNLFFNGWHPVIPWLGFLVFGMILSRLPLSERRVQWRLMGAGALLFAGANLVSMILTAQLGVIDPELAELTTTEPVPPMPLYFLAGMGTACVIIALCLLVNDRLKSSGVLDFVLPAGRQTLTLYIAHILIGMGTLEALHMIGDQTTLSSVLASLVFCLLATVFAYLWSKRFKRGPIEALMRRLAG